MVHKDIRFIPSLTPLRGIAAILVVFFHYNIFLGQLVPEGNFTVPKLYLMVDLFFILSGFIMYHVYGHIFREKIERRDFWNYMRARFARLYPLHLTMLLFLIGVYIIFRSKVDITQTPEVMQNILDLKAIPTSLLLIQAWGMHLEAPWNTASWSISVEWFLYLLFPLLILFMVRFKTIAKPVLVILVTGLALMLMYHFQPIYQAMLDEARGMADFEGLRPVHTIDFITGLALVRGFCGFVLGMVAYELYQKESIRKALSNGYLFPLIWLILFGLWYGDWLPDVLALGLFTLLILNTASLEGTGKRILNNKVLSYLGDISYSIYMVHMPLIVTLFMVGMMMADPGAGSGEGPPVSNPSEQVNYLANWGGAIMALLLVIGLASLTYRFIEKPGRKKLRPQQN